MALPKKNIPAVLYCSKRPFYSLKYIKQTWVYLVLSFVFFYSTISEAAAQSMTPSAIRKLYSAAIESASKTDDLHEQLVQFKPANAFVLAYLGATEGLKAKHVWNPYTKVAWVNKAAKNLAAAIKADPIDVEIRYLRFSMEHNLPPFLGHNHLAEDLTSICKQISLAPNTELEPDLLRLIAKFAAESGRCSSQQLSILKPYYKN